MFRFLFVSVAALALAACAGPITVAPQGTQTEIQQETLRQRELVYQRFNEDQNRVYNIAFPIMTANHEFCAPQVAPSMGMTAWNIESVPKEFRTAAQELYKLDQRLTVKSVTKNAPAARAGLRAGDVIVAIQGQTLPDGKQALQAADQIVRKAGYAPVDMIVERKGATVKAKITPVRACDYPVVLDYNNSQINAFADGEKIVLTKGILRFADNDREIAMIIAHELGHNAMGHIDKLRQNAGIGMLGGLAVDGLLAAAGVSTGGQFSQLGGQIGQMRFSVPFEQEADYVGMYFMERAGYNAQGVANFWRRMAAEGQSAIDQRTTHPASAERFLAIDRAYQEITAKKRNKQPLVPAIKK